MLELEGQRWRLDQRPAPDGDLVGVADEVQASARFDQGAVSGSGGVNRFSATYSADDDGALVIGPAMATLMAGPEPAAEVESAFFDALPRVALWESDGDVLTLRDASGVDLLVFVAWAEPPLVGTGWWATGINNGSGGVAGLVSGTEITAVFGDDAVVSGTSGVNRYHGTLTLEGTTLAVGPLAGTRMLGEGQAMAQEHAFLAAMARATSAVVDGDTLELRDADGALQVAFRTNATP